MDDLSKYYQVLGLEAGANMDEVKQAYRDLVKVWHPDRFAHDERLRLMAQEKLKEINGAYELLQAQAFEAAIAPESTTTSEPETADPASPTETAPPASRRVALWTTLGVLVLVLVAVAAIFFSRKGSGKGVVTAETSQPASGAITRYALSFPGNKGHLAISTTGSLSGTFTFECWAMTRKLRPTETIVSSRGPTDFGFDLKFRQRKRFHADIGDGSRWLLRNANATYGYGQDTWYHIAYVITPTNFSSYVNGLPEQDGAIYPPGKPLLYDANHHLRLGMDELGPDDLDGSIAEVRIWKTARTPEQIKANMNKLLAGNEPGLQGYWRFAEGNGTTAADSSGHGFVGSLVADVSWSTNGPAIVRR